MELKSFYAQDVQGNILPNATCYVYWPGTQTLVTGLTNADNQELSNPFTANSIGLVQFRSANGNYDVRISSGVKDTTLRSVFLFDPTDESESKQDYEAFRAYTGRATRIYITGLVVTVKPAGIAGIFDYDPSDTTSPDNGGTILVSSNGHRFKRRYSGEINILWFEADPLKVLDSRPAVQAAIGAARAAGGGTVYAPAGDYLINPTSNGSTADGYDTGILVSYTGDPHSADGRVRLVGDGPSTTFYAGGNNMILLRYGDSHGVVEKLAFHGNGKTNVVGMLHGPQSLTSTVETYQIYNVYKNLYFRDLAYGWWGQSSNSPNGACFYATLQDSFFYSCNVGIYIPTGSYPNGGCGRSLFKNIRIGQFCNVGLYAPGGISTSTFVHVTFEGIQQGTTPLAIPTAIYLDGTGDGGMFQNTTIEGCTRGVYNNCSYVDWFGGTITEVQSNTFLKPFRINVGSGLNLGGGVIQYDAPSSGANECYLEINPSLTPIWNLRFNFSTRQYIGSNGYHKFTPNGSGYTASNAYHEIIGKDNISTLLVRNTAAAQSGAGGNVISIFGTAQTDATLYDGTNGASRVFRVRSDGNVYNTNGVFAAFSDFKLKQDIVDATSQWADIKGLRLRKYRFKSDSDGLVHLGLIAQEAEAISPGLVDESRDVEIIQVPQVDAEGQAVFDDNGNPITETEYRETGEITKSVKYSILFMKAFGALQEAMARIEMIESEVAKFKQ